jgi:beta-phosphoglucomutase
MGVIFDMDGVLVDSYAAHFQSWKNAARRYGLEMSETDFKATFGRTTRDIIRHLWPGKFDEAKIAEFDAAKEADYRQILRAKLPVMAGAEGLIASLHAARFLLAIGSSGPKENIAVVLEGLKGGSFFDQTVNGSEVKHGKPDPEVFLLAARKLGLEPSRCAVVEDAPAGVEAARRAEMFSIGLLGTAPREALAKFAHVVVERLGELNPANLAGWISKSKSNTDGHG